MGDPSLNDRTLNEALTSIPKQSIILIEDLDTAFIAGADACALNKSMVNQEGNMMMMMTNPPRKEVVTYSGFLNALDGVASSHGNILIITTNHIEKLGDSLIRPGRIDHVELVSYAQEDDISDYFDFFFPLEYLKDQATLDHHENSFPSPETLRNSVKKEFSKILLERYPKVTMAELQNYFIKHRKNFVHILDDLDNFKLDIPLCSF